MKHVKYELKKVNDTELSFQILEQTDLIERGNFWFQASNGMSIESGSRPAIYETLNEVYIRGFKLKYDSYLYSREFFLSEKARDNFYNKVVQAFEELEIHLDKLSKGVDQEERPEPAPELAALKKTEELAKSFMDLFSALTVREIRELVREELANSKC